MFQLLSAPLGVHVMSVAFPTVLKAVKLEGPGQLKHEITSIKSIAKSPS